MQLSNCFFRIFIAFVLSVLFIVLTFSDVWADVLTMDDGSILKGKIIRQENNTLTFKTTYAGTLQVKWDKVKNFHSQTPVTIMLVTDELFSTHYVSNIENGVSQIKKEGENWKTAFKTKNVIFINPEPWRLNQGYKMTAKANISIKSQHGNTIKDEFDLDGRITFRGLKERYNFLGTLEHDTSNGNKTSKNWLFSGKYDYFISKKRYYGMKLSIEQDKFTDLYLRTTLGPYVGHQFFETKGVNLKIETGLSMIYEDFIVADDDDYPGLNWHVNYDQYFFNKLTQFYHEQTGIMDLDNTDKIIFNSWTGFRFPLRSGIVASAEVELEHDTQPNELIHKTDTTYRIKLGYQW
jgi:putative salt-induced outer membrane protein YdiY